MTDVKCDCVYNQSKKCKHVAALIYYINNEESASKTSHEQVWGKPSARQFAKNKYAKGKHFEEMFPRKRGKCYEAPEIDISKLLEESPLKQVMVAKAENTNIHTVKRVMDSLLQQVEINLEKEDCEQCAITFLIYCDENTQYKTNFKLDKKLKNFYLEKIEVSEKDIIKLCCETLGQSTCAEWYAARQLRLSASKNVHSIKVRTTKTIESLVSEILHPKKIDCVSTRYGLNNESLAREEYERVNNCTVKRVGIIVCKFQPWLCASLDGVVVEDGCISKLVEFKCPILCKDKPVINISDISCNVKYLELINGTWELKKSDCYYTQVQIQLYVSEMSVCDLFIYSPIPDGCCLIQVLHDEDFLKKVISNSEIFYFQHYLPALYMEMTKESNIENDENIDTSNTDSCAENEIYVDNNKSNEISPVRAFTGKNIINPSE